MKLAISLALYILSIMNPLQTINYTELETAVQKMDANKIVACGTDKILVSINNKESIYSKSQAAIVLKDFFTKKPVNTFKITVKPQPKGNVAFVAGEYTSGSSKFRISFQYKLDNEQYKIDKVTITEI